jgi:(p)ppGpp synthase/HD superfamily hydrolase
VTVEKAAAFATNAHAGQLDKAGAPYILHPERVAAAVASSGPEAQIVAWLHDVVEDTEVTLAEIEAEFGPVIAKAVDAISKTKNEPLVDYIARVATDPLAVIVKHADIADNSGAERMAKLPPTTQGRLREKYAAATALLKYYTA